MNTTLRKCIDCGRLFAAVEGVQQCKKCDDAAHSVYRRIEEAILLDKLDTVPALAASLEVEPSIVRSVLAELPHLARQVENDEACPRCGIRPATFGKEFCSTCLSVLDADLRDMLGFVERDRNVKDKRPEARMRHLSVGAALREKQRRTGHYRFNPAPPNIKGR